MEVASGKLRDIETRTVHCRFGGTCYASYNILSRHIIEEMTFLLVLDPYHLLTLHNSYFLLGMITCPPPCTTIRQYYLSLNINTIIIASNPQMTNCSISHLQIPGE